jgi:hypothetical protein
VTAFYPEEAREAFPPDQAGRVGANRDARRTELFRDAGCKDDSADRRIHLDHRVLSDAENKDDLDRQCFLAADA